MNPLKELEQFGQAPWLDNLSRGLVKSGELKRLAEEEGIKGLTSNPAIFEKSIGHSDEYDEEIASLLQSGISDVGAIFRKLAVADIKDACDALHFVYENTKGVDGYVSLEVSPYIAHETEATIAEAREIWAEVAKPNLMVKVPATAEGLPAIKKLIGQGININVTLLFAKDTYVKVAEAYIAGLEALPADFDLSKMASVASFFVSRIDAMIDGKLENLIEKAKGDKKEKLQGLLGKVAIANAKLAYKEYLRLFSGPRWEKLKARGARPQRLLWASTGVKNKAYPDTLYVDTLIGQDTVNTMPPDTVTAFRERGTASDALPQNLEAAEQVITDLKTTGISLDEVTDYLVVDGVDKFAVAADLLYGAIADKADALTGRKVTVAVDAAANTETIAAEMKAWAKDGVIRRLWAKDAKLWTNKGEAKWLGWLDIPTRVQQVLPQLTAFAAKVKAGGYSDAVLLGMGGSSLGADVVSATFGRQSDAPAFHILDSTDPDEIAALDAKIKLETTLFIVASKSGSTLEPNIFKAYYFDKLVKLVGKKKAGAQFVAITDPGSQMEKVAKTDGFADIFLGDPQIGGRFSVLSPFGLVPAAAMGIDVTAAQAEAAAMQAACGPLCAPHVNPGVKLGVALGALANAGKDKLTVIASSGLDSFGAWLEQLVAESTGKGGKGIVPVDGEPLAKAAKYASDRVFVSLAFKGKNDHEALLKDLAAKKQPIIRIEVDGPAQLFRLFYLWEIATAAAGASLGVNPFDQPDVEAAKVKTRALMDKGGVGPEPYAINENGVLVFAPAYPKAKTLAEVLKAHFATVKPGDYFAINAFIERSTANATEFNAIRALVRDKTGAATALGFGPRFLHSTGQLYKGGANTGVFIQVTGNHANAKNVPGTAYGFGAVVDAQAAGDLAVLTERNRRAIRVHLLDVKKGLKTLKAAVKTAL
jgi:transaldolase / glucose-6-phosphate isomerase